NNARRIYRVYTRTKYHRSRLCTSQRHGARCVKACCCRRKNRYTAKSERSVNERGALCCRRQCYYPSPNHHENFCRCYHPQQKITCLVSRMRSLTDLILDFSIFV